MDLQRLSAQWVQDGIITADQRQRILASQGTEVKGENIGAIILYALGGIVFGSAMVAMVMFTDFSLEISTAALLTLGALMAIAGVRFAVRGNDALADGFLIGAFVPFLGVFNAPSSVDEPLAFLPAIWGATMCLVRRHRYYPGLAGLILFIIFLPVALELNLHDNAGAWTLLLFSSIIFVGASFDLDNWIPWRREAQMIGTFALTISFMLMVFEVMDLSFQGAGELGVAIAALLALAMGLALKAPGYLISAAIVGAIDAIVFAFDLGGIIVGVGTLIAVALALLFGGQWLKKMSD